MSAKNASIAIGGVAGLLIGLELDLKFKINKPILAMAIFAPLGMFAGNYIGKKIDAKKAAANKQSPVKK